MKKSTVIVSVSISIVLVVMFFGFVFSFITSLPDVIESILRYTPFYTLGITVIFSLLYNKGLYLGKINMVFPLIISFLCLLVFVLWGMAVYTEHLNLPGRTRSTTEYEFAKNTVTELENNNEYVHEYIYSWEEESTGNLYTAHMPIDKELGGLTIDRSRDINISAFNQDYFDFFPIRFMRHYNNTSDVLETEKRISPWIMVLLLISVGLSYSLATISSGFLPKGLFQFLFLTNFIGINNVLRNIFVDNIFMLIVLSLVTSLIFLICAIVRVNRVFSGHHKKSSDVVKNKQDEDENIGVLQNSPNTEDMEDEDVDKKSKSSLPAFLFCFVNVLLWLALVRFASLQSHVLQFFIQHGIIPLVFFFFIVMLYGILGNKKTFISRYYTITSLVVYAPAFFIYVIFIIFVSPRINSQIQKAENEEYFKEQLLTKYNNAVLLKNENEMFRLAKYFQDTFPEEEQDFPEVAHFVGGKNTEDRKLPSSTKYLQASQQLTPINFTQLTQKELLQHTADYVEDGHFYAARLLITYYTNLYGVDTQRVVQLEKVTREHLNLDASSYELQGSIQLQRQITYLYNVLAKQEINDETVSAYYQCVALLNIHNNNEQLLWLKQEYERFLEETIFYADDVRLALFKDGGAFPILFVEDKEDVKILWAAKDVSYYNQEVFFESLELLAIDKEIGKEGEILWHFKMPYAKLVGAKLLTHGIERGNFHIRYTPSYFLDDFSRAPRTWVFDTSLIPKDVISLQVREKYLTSVQKTNYVFHFAPWEKHSLQQSVLYSHIVEDLFDVLVFMGLILFLVYMRTLYFSHISYTKRGVLFIHALFGGFIVFMPVYYRYLLFIINNRFSSERVPYVMFWFFVGLFCLALAVMVTSFHIVLDDHRKRVRAEDKIREKERMRYMRVMRDEQRRQKEEEE